MTLAEVPATLAEPDSSGNPLADYPAAGGEVLARSLTALGDHDGGLVGHVEVVRQLEQRCAAVDQHAPVRRHHREADYAAAGR